MHQRTVIVVNATLVAVGLLLGAVALLPAISFSLGVAHVELEVRLAVIDGQDGQPVTNASVTIKELADDLPPEPKPTVAVAASPAGSGYHPAIFHQACLVSHSGLLPVVDRYTAEIPAWEVTVAAPGYEATHISYLVRFPQSYPAAKQPERLASGKWRVTIPIELTRVRQNGY